MWMQTFGDKACHAEPFASLRVNSAKDLRSAQPEILRSAQDDSQDSAWSLSQDRDVTREILRCTQDDSQDTTQVRSRAVLSPNVWECMHLLGREGARCRWVCPSNQLEAPCWVLAERAAFGEPGTLGTQGTHVSGVLATSVIRSKISQFLLASDKMLSNMQL